jgi:phosphatidylethanolamine-binding protein (PEBP) family uncharacterized protein
MVRRAESFLAFLVAITTSCSAEIPYPIASQVVVTPSQTTITLGETAQFTAYAIDASGKNIGDVSSSIHALDPSVLVPVAGSPGLLKAVGVGRTELHVTAGSASGTAAVTATCPKFSGPTTHQGTIGKSEVWRAADSPHIVTGDVTIQGTESDGSPVTLVVESCSQVEVAKDVAILVGNGDRGELHVEGVSTKEGPSGRVTFAPDSPNAAPGHWVGIVFNSRKDRKTTTDSRLRHVRLVGAGGAGKSPQPLQAAVRVLGADDTAGTPVLDGVVIEESAGHGIALSEHAGLGLGSKNPEITKSALSAVYTPAEQVGTVPEGIFTQNGANEIHVVGGRMTHTGNWTVKSVPYLVLGDITVGARVAKGGVAPFLTLGAGVTLKFSKGTRLSVATAPGEEAGVFADGSKTDGIVLTSAEANPAPGDWVGVVFGRGIHPGTNLFYTKVTYAGGENGLVGVDGDYKRVDNGNIVLLAQPPPLLLQNAVLDQGAGYGIVRGYYSAGTVSFVGNSASSPPNFTIKPERSNNFGKALAFGAESPQNPLVLASERCQGQDCKPVFNDGDSIKAESLCGQSAKLPPFGWRIDLKKPEDVKPYTDLIKGYAMIVRQEHPQRSLHWLVYDIPATAASLAEGASPGGTLPSGAKQISPYNAACPVPPAECGKVKKECADRDVACTKYNTCIKMNTNVSDPSCSSMQDQCLSAPCDRVKFDTICAAPTYVFELRALDVVTIDMTGATTLADVESKLRPSTLGSAVLYLTYQAAE